MRAFELYFNPRKKDDLFLNSFVYTPANIYEKRLGNLYVVGELVQALPQNAQFLANLTAVIKKEYYASGLKKSCEASLQEALKKGNEFLEKESKNGNVNWLGNLNLGILSFKDPVLNFAKAGETKIFMARNGELADISQSLDAPFGAPPDPLKVFGNMAGGKLSPEDKIIVISKNILSALGLPSKRQGPLTSGRGKQNFLGALAKVSDEKGLKEILKAQTDVLANVSGICLVLLPAGEGLRKTVTLHGELPSFSFYHAIFKPAVIFFTKIKLPRFKIPKISLPKSRKPSLPKLPKINLAVDRKKIILVVGLILILVAFYYLFAGEKKQELKEAQQALAEAQTKAMLAESLLILKEDDRAKALFEETLDILSPLTKRGCPLRQEALSLQDSVTEYLK